MNRLLILLAFTGLLSNCKKEPIVDSNPETTEIQNGPGNHLHELHGFLEIQYIEPSTLNNFGYIGNALFHAFPQNFSSYFGSSINYNGVYPGRLRLNSIDLEFYKNANSETGVLSDTAIRAELPSPTWKLEGNETFFPFKATISRGFPSFNIEKEFPDSISKSKGMNVSLVALETDSVFLHVTPKGMTKSLDFHFGGKNAQINIPASAFTQATNGKAFVIVTGVNYSNKTAGGKHYLFANEVRQYMGIELVP